MGCAAAKFTGQAEPVLGGAKTERAWALAMDIAPCANLRDFFASVS